MIGDYYKYTAKTGRREKLKDLKNLTKFQFKEIQKVFAFLLMRSSKIKNKDSFTLIGLGTRIIQNNGIGTGTVPYNGFSQGSKPREVIILIFYLFQGSIALSFNKILGKLEKVS